MPALIRAGSGESEIACTISRASGPCTASIAQSSIRSLTSASGKASACAAKPGQVGHVVGGVGDGQIAIHIQAVGEEIVEHAAVLAAEHAVLRPAERDLRRRRWRAAAAAARAPRARWSRSRPCARRRRCRTPGARPCAPGAPLRTAPASPSPRSRPSSPPPPRGGRRGLCGAGRASCTRQASGRRAQTRISAPLQAAIVRCSASRSR